MSFARRLALLLGFSALAAPLCAQAPELGLRRRMTPVEPFLDFVRLVELTGDGRLELVVRTPWELAVWRGAADGAFREKVWSLGLEYDEQGTAFVDADGDGDLDLAVARAGSCYIVCTGAQNELHLNDGTGTFTPAPPGALPLQDSHPDGLVVAGDVDADGDVDLIFSGLEHCWYDAFGSEVCATSASQVWLADGLGGYGDLAGGLVATSPFHVAVLADLSGDGAAELFLGNELGSKLHYANDGAGHFTLDVSKGGSHPFFQDLQQVTAADVDLDGDLDLLTTYEYQGTAANARLQRNDGSGTLIWDAGELGGFGCQVHALYDGDADGDLDLVLAGSFDGRRFANDGAGHFSDLGALANYARPKSAAAGDVDLDGDEDVLFDTQLLLSDGSGAVVDATQPVAKPLHWSPRAIALLDLEGDGDLDAAVGSTAYLKNELLANDGAGHFAVRDGGAWSATIPCGALAAADLDGDGDSDLAAAPTVTSGDARVFRNAGGTFPTALTVVGADQMSVLVTIDADQDGDLDLALGRGSYYGYPNLLFANQGTGTFAPVAGGMPAAATVTTSLAVLDYDVDGLPDLVEGVKGEDRLLRNAGGAFVDMPGVLPSNVHETKQWGIGDVDLDGDLDLLAATTSSSVGPVPDRLYLGGGSAFVDASGALGLGATSSYAGALEDFDLDGDPDAFLPGGQGNELIENDGTGAFTTVATELPSLALGALALAAGDLDGDLDPDLFAVSGFEHSVLFSLRRQLAWRAIPRVGKALQFELDGTPGALFAQVWSTGTASLALPPFGVLRLDPAHLFPFASGALDTHGHALVGVVVPAAPSLLGAKLASQALIGDPLAFSNLETVVLTGL
jgi:hypothetical protein